MDLLWKEAAEHLNQGKTILLATAVEGGNAGATALYSREGKLLAGTPLTSRPPATTGLYTWANCSLFVQCADPPPRLIVLGGGHIAVPLAAMAQSCDFRVVVVDDRPDFANPTRFPGAETLAADFDGVLARLAIASRDFLVIVTRGHAHDRLCLEQALTTDATYIGMIGSKRKIRQVFARLLDKGYTNRQLKRVHAPIGLDIGAETPAEIAVSILAQLVQVRSRHSRPSELAAIAAALADKSTDAPWALATIVEAHGSTPRGVGARMLVKDDGSTIGTVGGGSGEKEVIDLCKEVMATGRPLLHQFKLTSTVAAGEGMVCGGNFTVFIQPT